MRFASLQPNEILEHFEVTLESGLSQSRVLEKRKEFGLNQLEDRGPPSPWKILLAQFQDLMVLILLVATAVAFFSWWMDGAEGLPTDAIVILVIVLANAWLGFSQEYKAEQIIRELQASTKATAQVLRDGRLLQVEQSELVPGDLVQLQEGDLVPADLILVNGQHIGANESLLTGESVPVDKTPGAVTESSSIPERTNELFAGTTVTAGKGVGIVVATGSHTELGKIAHTLQTTTSEETPLEKRLDVLGRQIGWGVLILSVLIGGVVLLVEGKVDTPTLLRVCMFSVALAVAAVPEGLPAVLTVSLSIGASKLAKNNVLCRQMSAVETLGSVTTIVTDKTGTLTKNEMTVRSLYCDGKTISVSGDGYHLEGELSHTDEQVEALIDCGVLASGGSLEKDSQQQATAVGDPMDAAFLVLAEKSGRNWQTLRGEWKEIDSLPFSSERARVSILRERDGHRQLFVKGSCDTVLPLCTTDFEGRPLTEEQLSAIRKAEHSFAEKALRGLALARRSVPDGEEMKEESLQFLGLAAFEDPPRQEVREAVELCQKAGIRVLMCTGDHPKTAQAIASRVGLLEADEKQALTGAEIAELEGEALAQVTRKHHVFARFSPQQKLKLVESLIEQGEVVAMTGDGVNDAPALKKVHVGVAMGKSGTAVAVEASDLVLTDDRFNTIVNAVKEGRVVYGNIQRFIAFLFSGNFGVVVAMFFGSLLAGFFDLRYNGTILLPLSAAQILWMNLVTDGAPALAFAMGRSSEHVMTHPPRNPKDPILSKEIWRLVFSSGFVLAALFLTLLDLLYIGGVFTVVEFDPVYTRTLAFYALVTARLVNAFTFTDLERGIWSGATLPNSYLIGAVLFSWLLTLGLVSFPVAADFFGLAILKFHHVLYATLTIPALVLLPSNMVKFWQRKR